MQHLKSALAAKIVGQTMLQESLMIGLLTSGHLLLESVPGLAKTTAAKTLAESLDASFQRIQCTPDLLPSDITGGQIWDQKNGEFKVSFGPVHANVVLLDEINRSSAKTQSAMLEAMEEHQTTIGGNVYPLPSPFLVLATQNPIDQEGTYQLSEAQMDRFMLKEILTYPTVEEEEEVVDRVASGVFDAHPQANGNGQLDVQQVLWLQSIFKRVFIDLPGRAGDHHRHQVRPGHRPDNTDQRDGLHRCPGIGRRRVVCHDKSRQAPLQLRRSHPRNDRRRLMP